MRTIHKFPFQLADEIVLQMPLNAEVVLVEVQPGLGPCIWAKVNTHLPLERRHFRLTGTGHEQPEMSWHLASFQMPPYVWHLWGALPDSTPIEIPQTAAARARLRGDEFRKVIDT